MRIVQKDNLPISPAAAHEMVAAMAYVESRYEIVDGLPGAYSQTGEPYVALVPGGIKPEGETFPIRCSTAELAIKYWLASFKEYADGKPGKLYWRERPEIGSWAYQHFVGRVDIPLSVECYYVVYSRLLISDEPWLAKDDKRVKISWERLAEAAA